MRRLRPKALRHGVRGISGTGTAALIAGIFVSLLVTGIVFYQGQTGAREVAQLQVSDLASTLQQRLGLATAYLRATAARLRGTDIPTREQFETFAASLGPQPVVDALIWLPVVASSERQAFEEVFLPAEGPPVSDLQASGERVSAASRPVYQPVAYFVGDASLGFIEGVDFLGAEALREASIAAATSGRPRLTPMIEAAGRSFFVLLLPVEPDRPGDGSGRALVGAILDLDISLPRTSAEPSTIDAARIIDVTDPAAPRLLFTGPDALPGPEGALADEIDLAGRRWRVEVAAFPGATYRTAALVLLGGLILSGLVSLFADRGHHLLIAEDLQREVDRQTAALQRSTAEFRALFEEGGAGKCELVPGSGHFRRVNLRLGVMLGYERQELERMTLMSVLAPYDNSSHDTAFASLLKGTRDSYFSERRFLTKSGQELWGEVSATVLRDEQGRPVWIVAVVQDVTTRKQAEEARQLLVRELAHRVKNTLQLARSLADQTARYVGDLPSFMALYQSRLRALATAHDQLFKTSWAGADLQDLVKATLGPYADQAGDRIDVDVPAHLLSSAETQTVALLVNELATNASKYGGLAGDAGHVSVRGHIEPMPDPTERCTQRLVLEWDEDAGHPVTKPSRRGFGTTFLTRAVAHQHDGAADVDWRARGVGYRFVIPLHVDGSEEADAA